MKEVVVQIPTYESEQNIEIDVRIMLAKQRIAHAAADKPRRHVAGGEDIGATGVFVPVVDGTELTFSASEDGFVDAETGSTWDFAGRALTGPLEGQRLRSVPHGNHFWFSWVVFRPDTKVWSD